MFHQKKNLQGVRQEGMPECGTGMQLGWENPEFFVTYQVVHFISLKQRKLVTFFVKDANLLNLLQESPGQQMDPVFGV